MNDETDDEGYGSILSDSSPSNKQGTTIYNLLSAGMTHTQSSCIKMLPFSSVQAAKKAQKSPTRGFENS